MIEIRIKNYLTFLKILIIDRACQHAGTWSKWAICNIQNWDFHLTTPLPIQLSDLLVQGKLRPTTISLPKNESARLSLKHPI